MNIDLNMCLLRTRNISRLNIIWFSDLSSCSIYISFFSITLDKWVNSIL